MLSIFPPIRPWLLVLTVFLAGCEYSFFELRIYTAETEQFDSQAVQAVFEEQSRIHLIASEPGEKTSTIDAIVSGHADLGLIENSTAFVPGVRAVIPVYESVMHLLIRDDFSPYSEASPMRGADFYVTNKSQAGALLVELITSRQGLEPGDYSVSSEFQREHTDIIVHFGPINTQRTDWYQDGFSLVSLTNKFNPHNEFYREGIGYNVPNIVPSSIPALTYDLPGNEKKLATLSVDTLLVAAKSVPVPVIYNLTKTFLEEKPRFTAIAPHIFSGIRTDFDPLELNFPLHAGTRRYLNRDEPGLLERYAESINLLVYLVFLLLTGVVAFLRWRNHRKKDRIDTFYIRALDIRKRLTVSNGDTLLTELNDLENEAFESLVAEKLAANDSFRIFTDLLIRLRQEIQESSAPQ